MTINKEFGELLPEFIKSNNLFSFNLLKEIYSNNIEQNVFISPLSLAINLAMLSQGSLGLTQKEIFQILELTEFVLPDINNQYKKLLKHLSFFDNKIQIQISNSVCLNKNLDFNPEFLRKVKTSYQASIYSLDFSSPKSKETINNWVNTETKGKISEIVDSLDSSSLVILLNAIYFKGEWTNKFNPTKTKPEAFYLENNKVKFSQMMFSDEKVESFYNKDFSAISLPYADGQLSLCLFLPEKQIGLDKFLKNLTLEKWQEYFNKPWEKHTLVVIPKFKLEFKVDLINHLILLGIKEAFSTKANFQAMIDKAQDIFISQVLQKTFLEVNEEGSEAAAVTMSMTRMSGIVLTLIFNRPFFYVIRDNQTGLILFTGVLTDPSPNEKELTENEQNELLEEENLKKKLGPIQYLVHKEMQRISQENQQNQESQENQALKSTPNKTIKKRKNFVFIFLAIILITAILILLKKILIVAVTNK